MRRYGPALLLLLSGAAVLRITVFSDLYLRYVQSGLKVYLIASGVLLLTLGALSAVRATRPHDHEAEDEDLEEDHDDDHGHNHHRTPESPGSSPSPPPPSSSSRPPPSARTAPTARPNSVRPRAWEPSRRSPPGTPSP